MKVMLLLYVSLCEKCPNTELFLVGILHSDWIRRDTSYLSEFSRNAGKYGPEMTPYLDTFHKVIFLWLLQKKFTIIEQLRDILHVSNDTLALWLKRRENFLDN